MTARNDGGPAFPQGTHEATGFGEISTREGGMSLRDAMAIGALAGIKIQPDIQGEIPGDFDPDEAENMAVQIVSRMAYKLADAMLAERDK